MVFWLMPQGRSSCSDLGQKSASLFTHAKRQPYPQYKTAFIFFFSCFTTPCLVENVTFDPKVKPDPIHQYSPLNFPNQDTRQHCSKCGLRTTQERDPAPRLQLPGSAGCLHVDQVLQCSQAHASWRTTIAVSGPLSLLLN